MAFETPQRLVRALSDTVRPDGGDGAWLDTLPELLDTATSRLGLTVERVQVPGGRSSLVALVRGQDGATATLKLAPPTAAPELEAAALAHWAGWGVCRLLDGSGGFSAPYGALTLERLHSEISLSSLPQNKALLEAADTVRKLWVEPPAPESVLFETVDTRTARQAQAMLKTADALVRPLVDGALALRDELVSGEPERFLLHGAFRQTKVLAGDRAPWLAVGPDPLVGERAYDLARLARDRLEDLVAANSGAMSARRRLNRLADSLEIDRDRLRGWTLFRATAAGVKAMATGHRREGELLLEFAGWL
ncbi:aminoglycoside phosphotransferase family protein [Streptomyces tsukubensis]|uniref:Kinase n=1 Tax=Streptomyces tsukubensis TaxID=83656 RepID=A0A1V4A6E6_9ACTN|nr:aminoglycoside phosphotransferase family protein [Streptomyces tsukubensis]OON76445.1 kinase [Streptomyces tsukubensis]QFR96023.1 kinase [Streptomyces tsukubensis]